MANCITRHIPNTVTCLNLFSGCIASVMAFEAKYELAIGFIILSAVFDFFDGMLARLLDAKSPIGKDLDSLADDISFGIAPALMVFSLFKEVHYPEMLMGIKDFMPYTAFLIAVFSALRLAKFNIDTRQTSSFIGLPVPANALFWVSRALSDLLDEADPIEGSYTLEVGSAGAERVLKRPADFQRYLNSPVLVKLYKPVDGRKEFPGTLTAYNEADGSLTVDLNGTAYTFGKKDVALCRLRVEF